MARIGQWIAWWCVLLAFVQTLHAEAVVATEQYQPSLIVLADNHGSVWDHIQAHYFLFGLTVALVALVIVLLWALTLRHAVRAQTAELRGHQKTFERIVNNIDEIVWDQSADRVTDYVSPAIFPLTGIRPEEVIGSDGQVFISRVDDRDIENLGKAVALAFAGQASTAVYRFIRRDGEQRWFETHMGPVIEDKVDGQSVSTPPVHRIAGITRDITDRTLTEQALVDSRTHIDLIAGTIPDALYLYDHYRQKNIWINHQITEMLGYSPQEINDLGDALLETVLPKEELERALAQSNAWIDGSEAGPIEYELRVIHKDGTERWFMVREQLLRRDPSRRICEVCGVAQDITQRKKRELEIHRSREHYREAASKNQRLLEEVNHRVRNNLANLLSLFELESAKLDVQGQTALEALRGRVRAMSEVHSALSETGWSDQSLDTFVPRLLSRANPDIEPGLLPSMDGPSVEISPRQTLPLSLVLLELWTNHVKHGGLGQPNARPQIIWKKIACNRTRKGQCIEQSSDQPSETTYCLELYWAENNGPLTAPKEIDHNRGLGLVKGFVEHELRGQCHLGFTEKGIEHKLVMQLDSVTISSAGI